MITLALSLFVNAATIEDFYDNTVFTSFKTLQECELYIQTHESEWIQTENLIKYSARCNVN
jgi:hypothetical protein